KKMTDVKLKPILNADATVDQSSTAVKP
ncbi:MAG: hypothetical protein ACJA0C_000959, partial [Candidatus Endobugula sp.]